MHPNYFYYKMFEIQTQRPSNITTMILTTNQIRESERQTMATEPIASIDLMERAGTRFVEHLSETLNLNSLRSIYLFCGPGNNGGDGLVIARLLAQKSIEVFVIDCSFDKKRTEEFQTNLQRFQQLNLSNAHLEPFDEPLYSSTISTILSALTRCSASVSAAPWKEDSVMLSASSTCISTR